MRLNEINKQSAPKNPENDIFERFEALRYILYHKSLLNFRKATKRSNFRGKLARRIIIYLI